MKNVSNKIPFEQILQTDFLQKIWEKALMART